MEKKLIARGLHALRERAADGVGDDPLRQVADLARDRLDRGAGALEGARDSVKWHMLHYIAVPTRVTRRRYQVTFDAVHLPKVLLDSGRATGVFYRLNGLRR